MCKGLYEQCPRRCLGHSKEVRAANRAEKRLPEILSGLLETAALRAVELTIEKLATPEALDGAISTWLQVWREALRKLTEQVVAMQAKVERAAEVRREHTQKRLDALMDEHRADAADRAIRQHEEAIIALSIAQERLRNVELLRTLDQSAEAFSSPRELVALALADASDELMRAHLETERLADSLKPADELPRSSGPRKGRPSAAYEAYQAAARRQAFWKSTHDAIAARHKATPSSEENLEELSVATELVGASKEWVITTRGHRDSSLALGRPRKVVLEPEVMLLHLPTTTDELLTEAA